MWEAKKNVLGMFKIETKVDDSSRMRKRGGGPGQPNEIEETCLLENICENSNRNDDLLGISCIRNATFIYNSYTGFSLLGQWKTSVQRI